MKIKSGIIAAVLSVILCLSAFIIFVSAENENEQQGENEPPVSSEEATQPQVTEPFSEPQTEPVNDETTAQNEPTYYTEPSAQTEPVYTETEPPYEPEPTEYQQSYEVTDEPDYYPDTNQVASNNVETIAVDGNGNDSDDVLTDSDWEELRLALSQNAGEDGGGDEFSAIKNNNSKTDDGVWILVTGVVLILISIGSFVVFCILTKKASDIKNALNVRARHRGNVNSRPNDDYGDSYSSRNRDYRKRH